MRSLPGLRLYILYFLYGLCGLHGRLLRHCRFLSGLCGCLLRGFSCRLPCIPFICILVVRLKSRLGLRGLGLVFLRVHRFAYLLHVHGLSSLIHRVEHRADVRRVRRHAVGDLVPDHLCSLLHVRAVHALCNVRQLRACRPQHPLISRLLELLRRVGHIAERRKEHASEKCVSDGRRVRKLRVVSVVDGPLCHRVENFGNDLFQALRRNVERLAVEDLHDRLVAGELSDRLIYQTRVRVIDRVSAEQPFGEHLQAARDYAVGQRLCVARALVLRLQCRVAAGRQPERHKVIDTCNAAQPRAEQHISCRRHLLLNPERHTLVFPFDLIAELVQLVFVVPCRLFSGGHALARVVAAEIVRKGQHLVLDAPIRHCLCEVSQCPRRRAVRALLQIAHDHTQAAERHIRAAGDELRRQVARILADAPGNGLIQNGLLVSRIGKLLLHLVQRHGRLAPGVYLVIGILEFRQSAVLGALCPRIIACGLQRIDLLPVFFRGTPAPALLIQRCGLLCRLLLSLPCLRPPFQLPVELIQADQAAVVLPGIRRRLLGRRAGLHLALHLPGLFCQRSAVPAHLVVVDGANDLVLPLLHRPEVTAQLVMADRICDLLVLLIRRLIALRRRFLGVRPVIRIIRAVLDVLPAAACLILPQSIKPAAPRSAGAACVSCLLVSALRLPSAPRLILPQSIKPCAFLRHIVLLIPSGFRSLPCSGC